jgi:hypothetical protein
MLENYLTIHSNSFLWTYVSCNTAKFGVGCFLIHCCWFVHFSIVHTESLKQKPPSGNEVWNEIECIFFFCQSCPLLKGAVVLSVLALTEYSIKQYVEQFRLRDEKAWLSTCDISEKRRVRVDSNEDFLLGWILHYHNLNSRDKGELWIMLRCSSGSSVSWSRLKLPPNHLLLDKSPIIGPLIILLRTWQIQKLLKQKL